jgi:predicted nuclease of restriction endonuclease-like (RecB) superfamily
MSTLKSDIYNTSRKTPLPPFRSFSASAKRPHIFDFLSLGKEANERAIETVLIAHMEKFILELGAGFAFSVRQYHLHLGNQKFLELE